GANFRNPLSIGSPQPPTGLGHSTPQLAATWRQSLPPCVSSSAFLSPPSGHKPYFREDHFSGGRPRFTRKRTFAGRSEMSTASKAAVSQALLDCFISASKQLRRDGAAKRRPG